MAQRKTKAPLPSANVQIEADLLGMLLARPDLGLLAAARDQRLDATAFYDHRHRPIFEAVGRVQDDGGAAELQAIADELARAGELDDAGGIPYLNELVTHAVGLPSFTDSDAGMPRMVSDYARRIVDHACLRQFEEVAKRAVSYAYAAPDVTPEDALRDVDALLDSVRERLAVRPGSDQMFTLAQLRDMELPPLRYIVPQFLPEGLAILAAKGKIGKSWMAYALAIAVASGGVWLGQPVESGDVLYLALEDGPRRLKDRATKLLADGSEWPQRLTLRTKWDRLGTGGGERRIERWLKAHAAARLVIIDVFAKVKPPRARNSDPYQEDYAAMEGLQALAQTYHVAIVVIHHTRKASAEDVYDELNGTTGLAGAADTLLVVQRPRTEAEGVLHITGREIVEETSYAVHFSRETCAWQLAEDQDADPLLSEETQDVIAILKRAAAPVTPDGVSDELGIPKGDAKGRAAVRKRLSRMADRGQCHRASFGRYSAGSGGTADGVPNLSHLSHSPSAGATNADGMRAEGTSPSVTPPAEPVTLLIMPEVGKHEASEHAVADNVTGVTASNTHSSNAPDVCPTCGSTEPPMFYGEGYGWRCAECDSPMPGDGGAA